MQTLRLTQKEFDDLSDYSCSVPTGVVIGKRWKRRRDYYDESKGWYIGEYVQDGPEHAKVKWYKPLIMTPDEELIASRLYAK